MSFMRSALNTLLATLVLLGSLGASAETAVVRHYDEIFERLSKMELVIFDLDSTLVRSERMLGSDAWFDQEWEENMRRGLSRDEARKEAERMSDRLQPTLNYDPVEPGVAKLIRDLQSAGVKVMIETARRIPQMEGAFKALHETGIDMSVTAPDVKSRADLVYQGGVLFANSESKGVVLERFIKAMGSRVGSIAFVDDKLYNLRSVLGVMRANAREYLAVHYLGAEEYNARFRQDVSNYQKSEFMSGRSIPSDADALRAVRAGGGCRVLFNH